MLMRSHRVAGFGLIATIFIISLGDPRVAARTTTTPVPHHHRAEWLRCPLQSSLTNKNASKILKKILPVHKKTRRTGLEANFALRGGGTSTEYETYVVEAYDWCCQLGAPSALVAGAVIATLYENMHRGDLQVLESDSSRVQLGKKLTRLLLLSAFLLEAISIFVTTVTGTMLLSLPVAEVQAHSVPVHSPLQFLRENYEFEYLTARITFLQGLLNWLAAIGLGHLFPKPDDALSTIALNKFIACTMGTVIIMMVSFYNAHLRFYRNYLDMLLRWGVVTMQRFFGMTGPKRPLLLLLWPIFGASVYYGYQALTITEEDVIMTIRKSDPPGRRSLVAQTSSDQPVIAVSSPAPSDG